MKSQNLNLLKMENGLRMDEKLLRQIKSLYIAGILPLFHGKSDKIKQQKVRRQKIISKIQIW